MGTIILGVLAGFALVPTARDGVLVLTAAASELVATVKAKAKEHRENKNDGDPVGVGI